MSHEFVYSSNEKWWESWDGEVLSRFLFLGQEYANDFSDISRITVKSRKNILGRNNFFIHRN